MIQKQFYYAWSFGFALAILGGTLSWREVAAAREARDMATDAFASAKESAARILELRAKAAVAEDRKRAPQDLLARAQEVLVAAGIRSDRLTALEREGDGAATSGGLRRQAVRLTLDKVRVGELGAFLALWRDREPAWVPGRIEILAGSSASADPALVSVRLVLEAWTLADAGGTK